jgi:hypothetical protein
MKANELRIGNLVKTKTSESAYDVRELNETLVNLSGTAVHYDHCIPIPLTEDRLLKFGFNIEWEGNGWSATLDRFNLWKGDNWDHWEYISGGYDAVDNDFDISVKYVHQLQNLYFALTGNELEIKKT